MCFSVDMDRTRRQVILSCSTLIFSLICINEQFGNVDIDPKQKIYPSPAVHMMVRSRTRSRHRDSENISSPGIPEPQKHSTTPKSIIKQTCEDILQRGHWKTWTEHGFQRDFENKLFSNPLKPDWPFKRFPAFLKWKRQNFTGTWAGTDNCDIREPTKTEKYTCLQKMGGAVGFIGDSRTRQLWRAFQLYINNQEYPFIDKQLYHDVSEDMILENPDLKTSESNRIEQNIELQLKYFWSQDLDNHDLSMTTHVRQGLSDTVHPDKARKPGNMVIIGDHILHPLLKLTDNTAKFENLTIDEFISAKFVQPFRRTVMAHIIVKLKWNADLRVYMLPAAYPIREAQVQENIIKAVDSYNYQFESLINELNGVTGGRFVWVGAMVGLSLSPHGVPLVPDSTHLNWPIGKHNDKAVHLVSTHVSLFNILFNYHCDKLNVTFSSGLKSSCCKKSE